MTTADIYRLAIEGELSIFTAGKLREQLLAALDEGAELEIDLSGVTEMDSAGVQLMIAAKREAAARNRPLRFTGVSAPVVDTIGLYALSGCLGDSAQAAPAS